MLFLIYRLPFPVDIGVDDEAVEDDKCLPFRRSFAENLAVFDRPDFHLGTVFRSDLYESYLSRLYSPFRFGKDPSWAATAAAAADDDDDDDGEKEEEEEEGVGAFAVDTVDDVCGTRFVKDLDLL